MATKKSERISSGASSPQGECQDGEPLLSEQGAGVRLRVDAPALQTLVKWEQVFDTMSDPIATLDTQHRIVQVNQAMADRLGLTKEQCVGQTCYSCLHGTDEPPQSCPHSQLLQDGEEHTAEVHEKRLGSDFLVSVSPLRDATGRLVGSVHVARDVTERKRTELALQELQARLRTLTETTQEGIAVIDPDENIAFANQTLGLITDITKRKQAEEALKRSEQRLRIIFDSAPDAYYLNDLKGNFLDANRAAEQLVGYDKEELLGKSFLHPSVKLLSLKDAPRAALLLATNLLGKPTGPDEFLLNTKNGLQVPVEIRTFPATIEGCRVVLGIARDITERKRAEEALRRRDAVLEAVAFAADRFLRTGDWEHDIQAVLARLGTMAGVSRVYIFENHTDEDGQLLTSQRYEWAAPGITPQIDAPELQDFSFRAHGIVRWQDTLARREVLYGHVRDFPPDEQKVLAAQGIQSLASVPIFVDGNWWGFIGLDECRAEREWSAGELDALKVAANTLATAIQRKDTEKVLRESERKFRALFNQTFQFIGLMTPDGTLIEANQTALRFAGVEEADVLGKPFWETAWWAHSAEHQNRLRDAVRRAAAGEFVRFEASHPAPDGTIHYVDFSLNPVKDEAGNVCLLIPEGRDINDRKRAEAALQKAHDELEHRVEERTAELTEANEQLRQEMAEHAQAERALRQSEKLLRATLESTADGILVVNENGRVTHSNSRMWEMWHVPDELLATGDDAKLLAHAAGQLVDPEGFHAKVEALHGSTDEDLDALDFKDGRVYERYSCPLVRDGKIAGRVWSFRDITERKRAEEALAENHRRYQNAIEAAGAVPYCRNYTTNTYDFVGEGIRALTGYSNEEFTPELWDAIIEEIVIVGNRQDLSPEEAEQKARTERDARIRNDMRIRTRGGEERWLTDASVHAFGEEADRSVGSLGLLMDITDRRQAEKSLRESEKRYRLLAENIDDVIWTCDLDFQWTYISPSVESLLGYTADEAMQQTLDEVVTPASAALARKTMAEILASGEEDPDALTRPVKLEVEHICKDGSKVWVEVNGSFLLGDDGRPVGIAAVTRDITERKQAEETLRVRARQQAALAELGQLALGDGDLTDLMNGTVRRLAETLDVEYTKVLELLPDKELLRLRAGQGWNTGLVGQACVGAGRDSQAGYTLLSSEPVIVEDLRSESRFSGSPLLREHGVVSGMSVIIGGLEASWGVLGAHTIRRRTFTTDDANFLQGAANVLAIAVARTHAEDAERKLSASVEHSPASIVITDRNGSIEYANPKFCEVTGYSFEEVIGEKPSILKSGETPPEEYEELWKTITAGKEWRGELHNKKKNGELYWESASIAPVKNAKEEITHFVAVKEDITEHKRTAEALRQSEQQHAAAERMAATGRMAAQVAHEINNPLAGIKNSFHLIRDAVPDDHPDRDMVERIDKEIDRIAHVVRQMYTLYSPCAESPSKENLAESVRDVVMLLDPLRREHEVAIEVERVPEELTVRLPAGSVHQILQNLLVNAIEASGEGQTISVAAELIDDAVKISVRDQGKGIPQDIQHRIFEPFVTSKTDEAATKGMGLGLATVKNVVEALNGKVEFETTSNRGTVFHVFLPLELVCT